MRSLVFFTLFGLALTAPIEDTAEVKAARALFEEAFAKAEKGEHASLSPVQIQPTYLADTPEVSASKANFQAYFNAVELAAASPYIAPIQTYSNVGGLYPYAYNSYNLNPIYPVQYNLPQTYYGVPVINPYLGNKQTVPAELPSSGEDAKKNVTALPPLVSTPKPETTTARGKTGTSSATTTAKST